MLSNKKKPKNKKLVEQIATLIAEGVIIEGDIRVAGGIQIDGFVKGSVISDDKDAVIRVSHTGAVTGEIRAPNIIINGHIDGNVFSGEQLELAEQAVVNGDVHYSLIEMVCGAEVNGKLIHDSGHTMTEDQPSDASIPSATLTPVSDSWSVESKVAKDQAS